MKIIGYKSHGRWNLKVKKFTADFETATWLDNETYVWAWATCDIENENIVINNSIDKFVDFCIENKNSQWFFHNLKFDGEFIIYWLEKHGFKHVTDKKYIEDKTYTTLISDMGQFYNIVVYFKKGNKRVTKATFIDSLKLIPFSVEETAKTFGLEINKLELDYNRPRSRYHFLKQYEKDYIKNDVLIMAKALKILFNENLTKMTRASNSIHDFKQMLGDRKFNHYFPKLTKELDEEIRKAYKRWIYLSFTRL